MISGEISWPSAILTNGPCSAVDHPVARHYKAASALREVDALIAAGARQALNDIELALARMHTGRYGYCRTCGLRIPLVVLEAIPKTTLCLACQGQTENGSTAQAARATLSCH